MLDLDLPIKYAYAFRIGHTELLNPHEFGDILTTDDRKNTRTRQRSVRSTFLLRHSSLGSRHAPPDLTPPKTENAPNPPSKATVRRGGELASILLVAGVRKRLGFEALSGEADAGSVRQLESRTALLDEL